VFGTASTRFCYAYVKGVTVVGTDMRIAYQHTKPRQNVHGSEPELPCGQIARYGMCKGVLIKRRIEYCSNKVCPLAGRTRDRGYA
jgi:hypothetical protein